MQDPWVQSLGQEDPLEKGMTTHSSILACRIPWTEEPGRLQFIGLQRVVHDWSNLVSTQAHAHYDKYPETSQQLSSKLLGGGSTYKLDSDVSVEHLRRIPASTYFR